MKILTTSDIHGNKSIIAKLVDTYEQSNADLLLICGDVGGKGYRAQSIRDFGLQQRKDYDYLLQALEKTGKPFYIILGNDDWFDVDDDPHCLKTGDAIEPNIVAFDYVNPTPFNTNREVNENKIDYELEKLSLTTDTIVLAHCPPFKAQDKIYAGDHVGSKSIRRHIELHQPRIWLCGHIHEDNGQTFINNTLIVNCASDHLRDTLKYSVIDTDTLQCATHVI